MSQFDAAIRPLPVLSGLEPHADPLSERDVAHLLRRASFGADPARVAAGVGSMASDVVAELVDEAIAAPLPPEPDWINETPPPRGSTQEEQMAYQQLNRGWQRSYTADWLAEMHKGGLRERMAFVWHDHFVTGVEKYRFAALAYRYLTLLRTYAVGNFIDCVREIGRDPAMLVYLDGTLSRVGEPNENYARELLELFTMGPTDSTGAANYTEEDIRELARAFTGWVADRSTFESVFVPRRHDSETKTIFGQSAAYSYDDAVTLIFERRSPQIARFVADSLYRHFVYAVPDPAITSALADQLLAASFEIAPVLRTLLSSAHFFDPAVQGAKIKGPVEFVTGFLVETASVTGSVPNEQLVRVLAASDQTLFSPPNVAGWPGHHDWINTSSLPLRWFFAERLLTRGALGEPLDLVPLAASLYDANDPEAAFFLPAALAGHLFAVPLEVLPVPEISDPFGGDVADFPVPDAVLSGPAQIRNLAKIFLSGQPWYEWYLYGEGANERLLAFVRHLAQYPEFQLS